MLSIQAEFNAEIIQGHREAFQTLREILADAAAIPDFRGSIVTPDLRRQFNDTTKHLGLRLRTAVAMLRTRPVKPPAETTTARTNSKQAHAPASPSTIARVRARPDAAQQLARIVAAASTHLAAAANSGIAQPVGIFPHSGHTAPPSSPVTS